MIQYFAMIAAWVGDQDLACEQLATAIGRPGAPSYGQLNCFRFGTRCVAILVSRKSSRHSRRSNFAGDGGPGDP